MSPFDTHLPERRRDVRHALPGHVRLVVKDALLSAEGGMLDVSAGGVRRAVSDGMPPAVGCTVEVHVTLGESNAPGAGRRARRRRAQNTRCEGKPSRTPSGP
ncbi:MAG: PilZ domain-containing protein [Planctomycetia bacterium]